MCINVPTFAMSNLRPILLLACLAIDRLVNASPFLNGRQIVAPPVLPAPIFPGAPTFPNNNRSPGSGPSHENHAVPPPSRTENCNSENCDAPQSYIVYPIDCKQSEKNNQITAALRKASKDGDVVAAVDSGCDGGVFVWLVKEITPDQMRQISKLPNVDGYEINQPLNEKFLQKVDSKLDDLTNTVSSKLENPSGDGQETSTAHSRTAENQPSEEAPETVTTADASNMDPLDGVMNTETASSTVTNPEQNENSDSSSVSGSVTARHKIFETREDMKSQYNRREPKLEKRSTIVRQQHASPHLNFISTPSLRDETTGADYLYPGGPYRRITVYMVDTGLIEENDEFRGRNVVKRWLYSPDLPRKLATKTDPDGHGSCVASVICGKTFGVFKDPDLIVAKYDTNRGSFLITLQVVLNDLNKRANNRKVGAADDIRGYTVVSVQGYCSRASSRFKKKLASTLKGLVELHRVVLVTAAGDGGMVDIDAVPASLADDYPIITVGAVDLSGGKRSWFSQAGPLLRVSGPGAVNCGANAPGSETALQSGTSFAGAATTGLVLALLANDVVGDRIRRSPFGFVETVRGCIMELAKPRDGSPYFKSIWNGIEPTKPDENYGWPPTHLKCLGGSSASLEPTNDGNTVEIT